MGWTGTVLPCCGVACMRSHGGSRNETSSCGFRPDTQQADGTPLELRYVDCMWTLSTAKMEAPCISTPYHSFISSLHPHHPHQLHCLSSRFLSIPASFTSRQRHFILSFHHEIFRPSHSRCFGQLCLSPIFWCFCWPVSTN